MREGKLLQSAKPLELYKNPVDTYVAEFFGRANHIPVKVEKDRFSSPLGSISMAEHMKKLSLPESGFLVHRPWDIEIREDGDFPIEILGSYFFGDYQEVRFKPQYEKTKEPFKFFTHIIRNFKQGDLVSISIPVETLRINRAIKKIPATAIVVCI